MVSSTSPINQHEIDELRKKLLTTDIIQSSKPDGQLKSGPNIDHRTALVAGAAAGAAGYAFSAAATGIEVLATVKGQKITAKMVGHVGTIVSLGIGAVNINRIFRDPRLDQQAKLSAASKELGVTVVSTGSSFLAGLATSALLAGVATAGGVVIAAGVVGIAAAFGVSVLADYLTSLETEKVEAPQDWLDVAAPIVLDLDGDGVELTSFHESSTFFDIDADGFAENTGWVGADDGLLAIDLNGDGNIGHADEFVFTRHAPGTDSDLEALAQAFDTNGDLILDANDTDWSKFRVWQDLNQDGVSDSGEVKNLSEWGITSLNLDGLQSFNTGGIPDLDDNEIRQISSYQTADGQTHQLADVGFLYSLYGFQDDPTDPNGVLLNSEIDKDILELADGQGYTLNLSTEGLVGVFGADGADNLTSGTDADVVLDGREGNDTLTGGGGADWISGGAGSDSISGGGPNTLCAMLAIQLSQAGHKSVPDYSTPGGISSHC